MPNLLESAYAGLAQGAYYTFGNINEGIKFILSRLPLQEKFQFELIMYQPNADFGTIPINNPAFIASLDDALINKFYLRSISIPSFGFEHERNSSGKMGVMRTIYPEDVTLTFIEDQFGMVAHYLDRWRNDIAVYDNEKKTYVYRDNQTYAKKNALLMMTTSTGIPLLSGKFMFYGLNYKSMEDITIGHTEEEELLYTVHCSIDRVAFFGVNSFGL